MAGGNTFTFANRRDPIPVIPKPSRGSDSGSSTPTSSTFDFSDIGSPDRQTRWRSSNRAFSKFMSQVVAEENEDEDEEDEEEAEEIIEEIVDPKDHVRPQLKRPGFSLPKLNLNLLELNARVGALFESQERALGLFTWERPIHTLCFLAVWTLVCLNLPLLPVLPLIAQLYFIMMPAFIARHPTPENDPRMTPIHFGAATAPPPELAPAAPTSRDFVRNMRDLQHTMENLNRGHDAIAQYVVPQFNFSDESVTTEIFIGTFALAVGALLSLHLVPWSMLLLFGGWAGVIAGHPFVASILHSKERDDASKKQLHDLMQKAQKFVQDDIILDIPPQVRQVEVFELQKQQADKWEPWLYSPIPYDPLSPARVAGARPQGTQFFEDVLPPAGWSWKEKKWTLDRSSTEWVQHRMMTGVEVETDGEYWVYDIPPEDEEAHINEIQASTSASAIGHRRDSSVSKSGWEETTGVERRGEWRRRRWIRDVEGQAEREGLQHAWS